MRSSSLLAFAICLSAAPAFAQAKPPQDQEHSAHHPGTEQSTPATPAPAQPGRMGGMMMGDMHRMMSMMHGGSMMADMPGKHVEGRIAFLKAELKITPAQEALWSKFADAARAAAKTSHGMMQTMMTDRHKAAGTAPAMLDGYEQILVTRLDAIRTVKAAFTPLYGALSTEQKKLADELLTSPMGLM